MNISFEGQLRAIKKIEDTKRYWFIRTFAGEAFDTYLDEKYIGLGLNNVPLSYIKNAKTENEKTFDALQTFINNNTQYKKAEATKWANQLIAFVQEIAVGDTVIIPSAGSNKLAFGTVTSEMYLVENPTTIIHRGKEVKLPEKRYAVEWDKVILKDDLQGNFRNLLSSHQGLTNADEYSEFIEGTLENIFVINNHIYLVLEIGTNEDINAFELNRFLTGLTYFYKEFCAEAGVLDDEDLSIKIKLQSRGEAYLKAAVVAGVIGIAGLLILSDNTEVKVDMEKKTVSGKSDGFLKSISNFLDANQKRKIEWQKFQDSVSNLKAQTKPDKDILKKDSSSPAQEKGQQK